MNLPSFINALLHEGEVMVGRVEPILQQDEQSTAVMIADFEREFRNELPANLPPLHIDASLWAAASFFRACQFAMYRDISHQEIQNVFQRLESPERTIENHYSVHLVFRFLPDLLRLSRSINVNDPLGQQIVQWAVDWPLSSVGIKETDDFEITSKLDVQEIEQHEGLLNLYVERIIKLQDQSRITTTSIRKRVCTALGEHHAWTKLLFADATGKTAESAEPVD